MLGSSYYRPESVSKFLAEPEDLHLPGEGRINTPSALIGELGVRQAPLPERRAAIAGWLAKNEPSPALRASAPAWPEYADLF